MIGDLPGGPIRWRMHIGAPPEKVYAAIDSARPICYSLHRRAGALRARGRRPRRHGSSPHARGHIGDDEWNEVHAGWLNVLFPLKAWAAHGIDLRNHDATRSWDRGYADQ